MAGRRPRPATAVASQAASAGAGRSVSELGRAVSARGRRLQARLAGSGLDSSENTDSPLRAATPCRPLRTDNGQTVQLDAEEAGSDRLGYGYATTVHRAQGATVERAHLFADGGGRELAYVALSRARQATQVWAVADDLPQGVEDLRRDWATRRTPAWAIDTALPDPATLDRQRYQALPQEHQARYAAIIHAEKTIASQAVVGINLPDRTATVGQAEQALHAARQARADLDRGTGLWAAMTRARSGT